MNSRPSTSPKLGKMPIRVVALAFDLCVLYDRNAFALQLPSKNTGKEGDCKSNSIYSGA